MYLPPPQELKLGRFARSVDPAGSTADQRAPPVGQNPVNGAWIEPPGSQIVRKI
jgi:hypothetical protein